MYNNEIIIFVLIKSNFFDLFDNFCVVKFIIILHHLIQFEKKKFVHDHK